MTTFLILGGARSGKSSRAQSLAEAAGPRRVFVATAEALDEEMTSRISRHRADRGEGWRTVEAPLDLVSVIGDASLSDEFVLIDCLTLWLSNLFHHDRDVEAETAALCDALRSPPMQIALVSNEIGLGLVPETPLGRAFRDAQGRLNQRVAAVCDRVEFVAAGLPLKLKG
ncbi:bifunctional adenosylcobinamide kinase/adenosylcobinamide-phosphate guanylyltransferase [Hyphomonas sp.]|jgi:adenosylcobinamide kinase/adenosylcobinamide-phosphate guanylyltransferase|uniref:bifunctional adenosylcobinamide kinase/adenosylcobinamide-phosphate guanylyltransferase n=1 Tax=Hyphomonas sp. TaxID=87 RepID=UPI0032D8B57F